MTFIENNMKYTLKKITQQSKEKNCCKAVSHWHQRTNKFVSHTYKNIFGSAKGVLAVNYLMEVPVG